MPSPYRDDLEPPNLVERAETICAMAFRLQGSADPREAMAQHREATAQEARSAWAAIWLARSDELTPAQAVEQWRAAMVAWARTLAQNGRSL